MKNYVIFPGIFVMYSSIDSNFEMNKTIFPILMNPLSIDGSIILIELPPPFLIFDLWLKMPQVNLDMLLYVVAN